MHPILFQIGNLKFTIYGLCYAIAFFIGIELLKKEGERKNIPKKILEDYGFFVMISGLLGGRLYYVLFNYSYYFSNPTEIIKVWHGGMAIHGGIIGGLIGTLIFSKKYNLNPLILGDMSAPLLLLGQTIGRFGNLANGEIHGVPTFTPLKVIFSLKPDFYNWYNQYNLLPLNEKANFKELVSWGLIFPSSSPAGSEFPNLPLHPAMLYEASLNFIGFLFLYFILRKKNLKPGTIICAYILIYSFNRTVVSFFRAEDLMFFGFRAPHVISLILVLLALIFLKLINNKRG